MAEISPFKAIHYDPAKAGDLATVVGPPYDVIGPEEQMLLYDRSPYNFVRIMLNQPTPADDDARNPYTRAAHFLDTWLAQGVLVEDAEPTLYVYRQAFTNPADGQRRTRTGLACALTLEPYEAGIVLPHEETRPKAKEDRLRLMRATESDPEPIFAMYEDEDRGMAALIERAIGGAAPFESVEVDGDRHDVWRVTNPATIAAVQERLRDRRVWIADGHHRYETALTYRDERRAADEGSPIIGGRGGSSSVVGDLAGQNPQSAIRNPQSYDSLLVVLTAFNDPGIVVLPTHRLVKNVPDGRLEQLYLLLERYFEVEPVRPEELAERMKADPAAGVHRFGVFMRGRAWALTLRDAAVMDAAVEGHSPCWKRLDVSILHALVLERCLDIPVASVPTSPDIAYTRDWNEAIRAVATGEYQLALLLNMPSAQEVRDVAAAGDKMPAKSTFFYPKLWSGLLMRRV